MSFRIINPLADDVAAASAALLFNLLPEIVKLPAPEAYARLQSHIHAALLAYAESLEGWGFPPEPSVN
jgi:hypothetical protein